MNRIVAKLFRQRIDRKSLFIKKKKRKKNETKLNRETRVIIRYHEALKNEKKGYS